MDNPAVLQTIVLSYDLACCLLSYLKENVTKAGELNVTPDCNRPLFANVRPMKHVHSTFYMVVYVKSYYLSAYLVLSKELLNGFIKEQMKLLLSLFLLLFFPQFEYIGSFQLKS